MDEIPNRAGLATGLLLLCMLPFSADHFLIAKRRTTSRGEAQTTFREALTALPHKAVVFVRYKPEHDIHTSLITNAANLEEAHAWTVYDRGELNVSLMREAPGRVAYVYEEQSGAFYRMDPATGNIGQETAVR